MKEIFAIHEAKMRFQGYAIGYEILQNGIIVKQHTYPVPVKNLVVNSGKDSYGIKGGDYNGQYYSNLGRCTAYLARGSGSTAAAAGNTQLEAQIGNRTNQYLSGDPYTGVKYTAASGLIQARTTYDSEVEVADRNINEIGLFDSAVGGLMFARIVLPATVTVLTGQQLRLTYELQITVAPIAATVDSPTITGWTTAGQKRLEGRFPTTTSYGNGSNTNDFLNLWRNDRTTTTQENQFLQAGSPYQEVNPNQGTFFEWFAAKTFNTWGDAYTVGSGVAPNNVRIEPNSGSGTATATLEPYVNGNYYRDITVVAQPTYPSGLDATAIKAIRCRGLTHIFDTPVAKLNTQRLTLVFRVSWA